MKQIYFLLSFLITSVVFAQIPSGYYDYATGTGYTLKTQLKKIIDDVDDAEIIGSNEHIENVQSYNALDNFNSTYELDNYYEVGSNKILDIYSENPTGVDPYNFTPSSDECGSYSGEGDCYNKEHVIPQSVFSSQLPMYSDAHHLLPTDGRVNGFRSNYPFGRVNNSQLVSQSGISNPTQNGSKLGSNLNSGYSAGYSGIVFEPIDEFKGDIARIYFYFATRFQDEISSFGNYPMFDGTSDKVFDDTFLSILLTWNALDPVSQKEIDRNNNIYYHHQNNRNPFVDHPEYIDMIWNLSPDTEVPSIPTNLIVTNEGSTSISISWTASTDNVAVTSYDIYVDGVYNSNSTTTSTTVTNLTPETTYTFTVLAKDAANNTSAQSASVDGTTTQAGSSGSECGSETFENIGAISSAYITVNWTGDNGLNWTATDTRTDQVISNGKAITVRDGSITIPTSTGGIGSLTVTTQLVFTGTAGTFNLKVNGSTIGTIAYSNVVQTITIPNINIENNVSIVIDGNSSSSNRVKFDDLSWTCYASLGVNDYNLSNIKIYPNPISKNYFSVKTNQPLKVEIFDILGKSILKTHVDSNNSKIDVNPLTKGLYLVKLISDKGSVTKKIIKQ
jgi:endonuclease I